MTDVLFLAPHNDDEALFGAYTIMRRRPLVVICTDSWIHWERGTGITAKQRKAETSKAMGLLGCKVEFLGIKDTELNHDNLGLRLLAYNPSKVYAPKPNSINPQHNLVGNVAQELWPGKVIFYSTYTKDEDGVHLAPSGEVQITPVGEEIGIKNKMLACYESQISLSTTKPHFDAVYGGKPEFLNFVDPPSVSAVLLKWKRPKELEKIKENLRKVPYIKEIITWENTEEDNKIVWGRYLAAKKADHDIIYVQDDDIIVNNVGELLTTFDGKHMSNLIRRDAWGTYASGFGETLIGWGAVFKKEWLSIFDEYLKKYPCDNLFMWNADRIFAILLNRRHNTIPADLDQFESATGKMALYRQAQHRQTRHEAVVRAQGVIQ